MSYNPSYSITVQKQEVIIRFDRNAIDQAALGRFLDYLEFESIRKRSQLTAQQAATLATEVKQAVWQSLKRSFAEG